MVGLSSLTRRPEPVLGLAGPQPSVGQHKLWTFEAHHRALPTNGPAINPRTCLHALLGRHQLWDLLGFNSTHQWDSTSPGACQRPETSHPINQWRAASVQAGRGNKTARASHAYHAAHTSQPATVEKSMKSKKGAPLEHIALVTLWCIRWILQKKPLLQDQQTKATY